MRKIYEPEKKKSSGSNGKFMGETRLNQNIPNLKDHHPNIDNFQKDNRVSFP